MQYGTSMAIIAINRGHFAPLINCQRNLIFKMADKNYGSQGKRIPYDILNNLRKRCAFGSILQGRNRRFYDCLGNILHRRSDIESGKFALFKGLSFNRRVFCMTSARF